MQVTVPVPTGMKRFAETLAKPKIYEGKPCKTCGNTARYEANRGCVWCIQKRTYAQRAISATVPFENFVAAIRSNSAAQELYGDDFEQVYAENLAWFKKLTGTEPHSQRFYFSLKQCQHVHPSFRSVDTGKCTTCEVLGGRFTATRRYREHEHNEHRQAAIRAFWVRAVGLAQFSEAKHHELPSHLRHGRPCLHGHPGVKYKNGGACWFCLNSSSARPEVRKAKKRKNRNPAPSLIWAALVS